MITCEMCFSLLKHPYGITCFFRLQSFWNNFIVRKINEHLQYNILGPRSNR